MGNSRTPGRPKSNSGASKWNPSPTVSERTPRNTAKRYADTLPEKAQSSSTPPSQPPKKDTAKSSIDKKRKEDQLVEERLEKLEKLTSWLAKDQEEAEEKLGEKVETLEVTLTAIQEKQKELQILDSTIEEIIAKKIEQRMPEPEMKLLIDKKLQALMEENAERLIQGKIEALIEQRFTSLINRKIDESLNKAAEWLNTLIENQINNIMPNMTSFIQSQAKPLIGKIVGEQSDLQVEAIENDLRKSLDNLKEQEICAVKNEINTWKKQLYSSSELKEHFLDKLCDETQQIIGPIAQLVDDKLRLAQEMNKILISEHANQIIIQEKRAMTESFGKEIWPEINEIYSCLNELNQRFASKKSQQEEKEFGVDSQFNSGSSFTLDPNHRPLQGTNQNSEQYNTAQEEHKAGDQASREDNRIAHSNESVEKTTLNPHSFTTVMYKKSQAALKSEFLDSSSNLAESHVDQLKKTC